ncbi:MAG: diadenylate cyclase CdaA [Clostridiales bacterium]|nr:diadenylate cyclase CdaA [Clostridiales bacterium]
MGLDSVFNYVINFIRVLRINDLVDVFVVAVAVYYFMMAIRGTRAVQLVKGILLIVVVYMTSSLLRLHALNYILSALVQVAMFGVIVIFQPELRTLLEKMGRLKVGYVLGIAADPFGERQDMETMIDNIAGASAEMSKTHTGALIVIERHTRLGEYMNSGTPLNAIVSKELLKNIFVPNTPLHDGAVIIRDNRIITAGCVLPLTANTNLTSELGTRHRAALGLSEASDALIIVVSEETGKISIAVNGSLTRNLTELTLKKALTKLLVVNENGESDSVKKIFRKIK